MPSKSPSKKLLLFREPSQNPSEKRVVAWPPWRPWFLAKHQGKEDKGCWGVPQWPHIGRYRETISAILPYCAEPFPHGEHAKWRCDNPPPQSGGVIPPPPQKGYLSKSCAIPHENKAKWVRYPLCGTISKEYCAIWGGISHWPLRIWCSRFGFFFQLSFALPVTDRAWHRRKSLCMAGWNYGCEAAGLLEATKLWETKKSRSKVGFLVRWPRAVAYFTA